MANIVDAKGRSCPEPVIMTKKALNNFDGEVEIKVDEMVAVENIKRFAENKGFNVKVTENSDEFSLTITKE